MRRLANGLLVAAPALALLTACFHAVLFRGEQFAYRDAAHFYYPLYQRVQQEWQAGRWPLWDPWQDAGMPLLGMPMAAALYPGKALFAVLPYPAAYRLYAVAHVALAWAGMLALARAWGRSPAASGLAALAYAFGAPVLFQYCNVIFLVGAAWAPWGLAAADALLARGRRWGLPGLAAALAMQVLGGDPEAAYLTVLAAAGYAIFLALWGGSSRPGRGGWWWASVASALVAGWVGITLGVAYAWPRVGAPWWLPPARLARPLAWGLVGLGIAWAWWRRPREARLGPMLAGLGGACALATALAAVQIVPTLEFTGTTFRAADDSPERIYGFDVEPYRALELAWPSIYGMFGPENRSWIQAFPPAGERRPWTPSLYVGALTLALALVGLGRRGAGEENPALRAWLSAVAVVALLASFGRFGGPLWLARWLPGAEGVLGPHDPTQGVIRSDAFLHDGEGSVYGLLAAALPGFDLFRYPAKLFTFASLALAGLSARGWDRACASERGSRAAGRLGLAGLSATLAALALILAARGPIAGWLARRLPADVVFGPADPGGAIDATLGALVHGGVVFASGLGLAWLAPRRPRAAGALALVVMALDLGAANARLVWTVPQAAFEAPSLVARLIDEAERADPSPFRLSRLSMPHPNDYLRRESPRRLEEATAWERNTMHPLYGLPLDIEYTLVEGVLETDDYVSFFGGRLVSPRDASGEVTGGPPVYTLPRRGFDLWNSRYVLMPVDANGWVGENQGYVRLYPPATVVDDPSRARDWIERENWQLVRNLEAFPRAWIVHFARVRQPVRERQSPEAAALMRDLVYQADPYFSDPNRPVYDLRAMAFVETDRPRDLAGYVARASVTPDESVVVARNEPLRVELVATLARPGLVVLADTYYPGWRLSIDGRPAPIYRTNRMMRGAAVAAGRHTLVYTYEPDSFKLGAALSIAGLVALAALLPWAASRGRSPG